MNTSNLLLEKSETLTKNDFDHLLNEQILTLAVNEFLPCELTQALQQKLSQLKTDGKQFKGGAPINRIGQPWFTTKHGQQHEQEYFEQARQLHQLMAEVAKPYQPPIDRVVAMFDRIWPGGAMIGKIDGQLMSAGLVRDITKGKSLPWHVDANRFGPDGRRGTVLDTANINLFGNIYITTDGHSGRLKCKNQRPNPLHYSRINNTGFGANEFELEADVDYLPLAGTLALGHADKWHKVDETVGRRITVSFFVAVYDEQSPLIIYS